LPHSSLLNAQRQKVSPTLSSGTIATQSGVPIPKLPLTQLSRGSSSNHDTLMTLASNAASGLLRALSLGTKRWSSSVIQDMLCVLSICFRYSRHPEVASIIENGLKDVHVDNWLGILPQLIARIDHPEPVARQILHNLLFKLGEKHCRAILYPLFVALKSPKVERKSAAETIMNSLKQHSKILIDQALMVSQELIRVAILWHEEWHETIEEASRLYFSEGNIQGMLDVLQPLQSEIDKGPNTVREGSFIAAYGQDLRDAWEALKNYQKFMVGQNKQIPQLGAVPVRNSTAGQEDTYLHQAWDLYYNVFTRITQQLPSITSLELQTCSPALMEAQDLAVGIPGTYAANGSFVRIQKFGPTVHIIRSKQRPRKIRIYGQDGNAYVFLLKGHEDLRQDERAMQFFGLVNALLQHDNRVGGESHDLSIQRYAVLPLSPTAGLISWVPNCDTLHDLIREYRDAKKTMFNLEHKLMQQLVPANAYDQLSMIGKLEVFEHALSHTSGDDLAKIQWIKSESSEVWLQRRTNYTRSLAVMSIVGYVLGLGDRHPSNLMIDRKTGKILHIDFGDCFEVAQHREKFPEKVPFRLTRMLINAMEVSGIEGTFRLTCEKVMVLVVYIRGGDGLVFVQVMAILRENSDSLIAVLDAFIHDPLVSWRLLNATEQ
jgi:FKBP12-rapamycin complex-associated protein